MGALMKCGCNTHAVNAITKAPVCVIHIGSGGPDDPAMQVEDNMPDLSGRVMRCSYDNGRPGQRVEHRPIPSNAGAAFFQHQPDKDTDLYYCGCWGWD